MHEKVTTFLREAGTFLQLLCLVFILLALALVVGTTSDMRNGTDRARLPT